MVPQYQVNTIVSISVLLMLNQEVLGALEENGVTIFLDAFLLEEHVVSLLTAPAILAQNQ